MYIFLLIIEHWRNSCMAVMRLGKITSAEEALDKAQERTITDINKKIGTHKIALMVRPTGFGKTRTMIKLSTENQYKKVLYLYPNNIIKQSVIAEYHDADTPENPQFVLNEKEQEKYPDKPIIVFKSYSAMLNEWKKIVAEAAEKGYGDFYKEPESTRLVRYLKKQVDIWLDGIDLMLVDEAHRAGADGFMQYWPLIHAKTQNGIKSDRLHVLGATATPMRTDSDNDLETDIFYYERAGKVESARIADFPLKECFRRGILKQPYYAKGMLDADIQKDRLKSAIKHGILGYDINPETRKKVTIDKKGLATYTQGPRIDYLCDKYYEALEDLENAFSKVVEPHELIKSSVNDIIASDVASGAYMRFLVFYQQTSDVIKYKDAINEAFRKAFNIGGAGSVYKALNDTYLMSNTEVGKANNIPISPISSIAERDEALENDPSLGFGNIDLIHSIDMLNMGYHVGNVTGIVIKRGTSSEIIYYQQIGRCMSVKAKNSPIIIDFANADAELFRYTHNTVREKAAQGVKEFISCCKMAAECEAVNKAYNVANLSISSGEVPEEILKYLYIDRCAPLYFIKGVAESLGSSDSFETLIKRLNAIVRSSGADELNVDYNIEHQEYLDIVKATSKQKGIIAQEEEIFDNLGLPYHR